MNPLVKKQLNKAKMKKLTMVGKFGNRLLDFIHKHKLAIILIGFIIAVINFLTLRNSIINIFIISINCYFIGRSILILKILDFQLKKLKNTNIENVDRDNLQKMKTEIEFLQELNEIIK